MKRIEYRVRAKTVYHITKFVAEKDESGSDGVSSESYGIFENQAQAEQIALSMKYADEKLGDCATSAYALDGYLMHPDGDAVV